MSEGALENFIFFVTMDGEVDDLYLKFSNQFQALGLVCVPLRSDQVSQLAALSEQGHISVILSTRTQAQQLKYRKRILPVLSYLLRQERLTLFHLSSFSMLDEGGRNWPHRNYFFLKYPLNLKALCGKIQKYQELRMVKAKRWPGGRRAKLPGTHA